MDVMQLKSAAAQMINVINQVELENNAAIKSRENLERTINQLMQDNANNKEVLDIATHAIEILRQVSDETVSKAYGFLEQNLNETLARMFENTTRKIEIKESIRANQYPQLELILHVGNGKTRSLKTDSGHGLAQIVSLLSILSLIVITGSRRILVMDEIISGLSVHNRKIVTDILWSFTEIGFQFIINDHGYIPEGSHVYHLEMVGDVSGVKQHYIAKKGVYLQGGNNSTSYDYSEPTVSDILKASGLTEDDLLEQGATIELGELIIDEENSNSTEKNDLDVVEANGILSI